MVYRIRKLFSLLVLFCHSAWSVQTDLAYSFVQAKMSLPVQGDPLKIDGKVLTFSLTQEMTDYYKLGATFNYLELNVGESDRVQGIGQTLINQEIGLLGKNESGLQLSFLANVSIPTLQFTANGAMAEQIMNNSGGMGYSLELGPKATIIDAGYGVTTIQATTELHQKDRVPYYVYPTRSRTAAMQNMEGLSEKDQCQTRGCQTSVSRQLGTTTNLDALHLRPLSKEFMLGGGYTYSWTTRGSYESEVLSERELAYLREKSNTEIQLVSAMMVYLARVEKQNFSIVGRSTFSVATVNLPSVKIFSLGFAIPF